jgi:predicted PurR-regulated permease PerM
MPCFEKSSPMGEPVGAAGRDHGEATFLRRVLIVVAIVAVFVLLAALPAVVPDVALLVFAAVWFGVVLSHAANTVSKQFRLPRQWSLGLVVTLFVALITGFFVLLGWQVAQQLRELLEHLQRAANELHDWAMRSPAGRQVAASAPTAGEAVRQFDGAMTAMLMTPFGFLINVLFIFFGGLFLAVNPDLYVNGFVRLFPVGRRSVLREVLKEAGEKLWQWTFARLIAMFAVGVASGVGLWLLGVPMALTLGILSGLFDFVPNVGPIIATALPVVVSLPLGGLTPLWVLLLYFVIQQIESFLLTPIVMRRETRLPPAVVLAAQLLFWLLFGILGVTFATPVVLVVILFVRRFYVEQTLEGRLSHDAAA